MINPLKKEQIEELKNKKGQLIGRVMCSGKAVDICSGELVGGNVIYHPVYWDFSKDFFKKVVEFLKENNPDKNFRVEYSK